MANFQSYTPQRPGAGFLLGSYNIPELFSQNIAFALLRKNFIHYNDVSSLQTLLDMQAERSNRAQLVAPFLSIPQCKANILTCMLEKGFVHYGFGFASELTKQQEIVASPFPYLYENYPVRVWGFKINPSSSKAELAQIIIASALQLDDKKVLGLLEHNGLQSVFPSSFEKACTNVETYSNLSSPVLMLCDSPQDIAIISESKILVNELFSDLLYQKLEEKKLNPDLYLEKASL